MARRARRSGARNVVIACSQDVRETLETVAPTVPVKATLVPGEDRTFFAAGDPCDVLVVQSASTGEGEDAGTRPAIVLALLRNVPVVSLDWAMKSVEAGNWLIPSTISSDDNDEDSKDVQDKAKTETASAVSVIESASIFDRQVRERVSRGDALRGLRVGVSGNLPSKDRQLVQQLVERAGGSYVADDQENVDVLIVEPSSRKEAGKGADEAAKAAAASAAERIQCVGVQVLLSWILAGKRPTAHLTPAKTSRRRASRGKALTPTVPAETASSTSSSPSATPAPPAPTPTRTTAKTPSTATRATNKSKTPSKSPATPATQKKKNKPAAKSARKTTATPRQESKVDDDDKSKGDTQATIVIAASGLQPDERDVVVKAIAHVPGARMVKDSDTFADAATHIVVPTLRSPLRTVKVANGIARGAWVLEASWVYASIEAGAWVPEADHEASDRFPGCKTTRLLHQDAENGATLLNGVNIYVDGAQEPPTPVISHLLRSSGATLVKDASKASVRVCGANALKSLEEESASGSQQLVVRERWVFDSLQAGVFDLTAAAAANNSSDTKPTSPSESAEAKTPSKRADHAHKVQLAGGRANSDGLANWDYVKVRVAHDGRSKRPITSIDDVMAETPPKKARAASARRKTPPRSARAAQSLRMALYDAGSSDEEDEREPDADFASSPDI
ncbi:Microcephalin [Hondaea fermentalgiana]|uniref:Microcephalin n=1 Tax=Hondaea fermentalgiana TaxID=2315210 RepID=A0A2R5GIM2_9STRA|nr:Microcephalin [Hondaea fermentalgiana]|eukprot:GBG30740.1 Microcephalin [Hondaea fermentalgiana]